MPHRGLSTAAFHRAGQAGAAGDAHDDSAARGAGACGGGRAESVRGRDRVRGVVPTAQRVLVAYGEREVVEAEPRTVWGWTRPGSAGRSGCPTGCTTTAGSQGFTASRDQQFPRAPLGLSELRRCRSPLLNCQRTACHGSYSGCVDSTALDAMSAITEFLDAVPYMAIHYVLINDGRRVVEISLCCKKPQIHHRLGGVAAIDGDSAEDCVPARAVSWQRVISGENYGRRFQVESIDGLHEWAGG